jgi:hypothetical protein
VNRAVAEIEGGVMPRAVEPAVRHASFGQRCTVVRAFALDGYDILAGPRKEDDALADPAR